MVNRLYGPLMLGHDSLIHCGASAYGVSTKAARLSHSCFGPDLHMLKEH